MLQIIVTLLLYWLNFSDHIRSEGIKCKDFKGIGASLLPLGEGTSHAGGMPKLQFQQLLKNMGNKKDIILQLESANMPFYRIILKYRICIKYLSFVMNILLDIVQDYR